MSVDAVVYYRVSNATVSVANVENAHHSTRLLAQTTLRNVLGTKNLAEILSEREAISNSMQVNKCEGHINMYAEQETFVSNSNCKNFMFYWPYIGIRAFQ